MKLAAGICAVLTVTVACSESTLWLRGGVGVDAATSSPADVANDALGEPSDDRTPPVVNCGELGPLADGRRTPRAAPSRGSVRVLASRPFGSSSSSRGGYTLLSVGGRYWWSEGTTGCRSGAWGARTWTISVEPDTIGQIEGACEPGSSPSALNVSLAWNGNVICECYAPHTRGVGGGIFVEEAVECGQIFAPGSFQRTFTGPRSADLDVAARGGAAGFLVLVGGGRSAPVQLQYLGVDAHAEDGPIVLAPMPWTIGRVSAVETEAWAVIIQKGDEPVPDRLVRVGPPPSPAVLGEVEIPTWRDSSWKTQAVGVLNSRGGLAVAIGVRNAVEESNDSYANAIDLALACRTRAVRVPVVQARFHGPPLLLRDGDGYALLAVRVPEKADRQVVLWRLDADGTVRGDGTVLANAAFVTLRSATTGPHPYTIWVVYSTSDNQEGANMIHHVAAVELR